LCFEINELGAESQGKALARPALQCLIFNIMHPQWCRALKEMRDLGQLRSDLHIEGIRSALIG